MHVLITGSSGLVGTALVKQLSARGHQITRLVRRTARPGEAHWDPQRGTIDDTALRGVDAVVHLAGEGIAEKRWTDEQKQRLVDSRIMGTSLIARAIATAVAAGDGPPPVLLSGSAIGYYGARGDEVVDEQSAAGTGFLADLCVQWEAAAEPAVDAGARVAFLRTGIVLSGEGGALKKQLPLFKLGLGGTMGSGRQWQSWISIDDEVGAIVHLLASNLAGPVNLTAPHAVRQAEFAKTLGSVLHRPALLPIPAFGPKLLLGSELVENVLLTGQHVAPTALLADGYEFEHPTLEVGLRAVLHAPG